MVSCSVMLKMREYAVIVVSYGIYIASVIVFLKDADYAIVFDCLIIAYWF